MWSGDFVISKKGLVCKWLVSGFIGVWLGVGVVTVLTVSGGVSVGSAEKV